MVNGYEQMIALGCAEQSQLDQRPFGQVDAALNFICLRFQRFRIGCLFTVVCGFQRIQRAFIYAACPSLVIG
ncbi:hypothetical protein D1872_176040 [compost metagenome]